MMTQIMGMRMLRRMAAVYRSSLRFEGKTAEHSWMHYFTKPGGIQALNAASSFH
jgi:hypothetical protein